MILALTKYHSFDYIVSSNPNLVAWWKADETSGSTLIDYSGGGHDATYSGSQVLNQPPLRTGSTGCVQMTTSAVAATVSSSGIALGTTSGALFTMACFVKRTANSGSVVNKFFGYGPANLANEGFPSISYSNGAVGGTSGHAFGFVNSTNRFQSSNSTTGTTIFIALVKTSATTWILYENGVSVGTLTTAFGAPSYTTVEFLGTANFPGSYAFIGYGSDFMLFNDALSAGTLLSMAQAGGVA